MFVKNAVLATLVATSAMAGEKPKVNPTRPLGHVLFCHYNPSECISSPPAMVSLSGATMAKLELVNANANARKYRTENGDKWGQGSDCEDYAIRKRRALISKGVPPGALRYAKGTLRGKYHVVLIVRTTRGDLVLDNITPDILSRAQSAVRLESMSTANPKVWVKI